MPDSTRSPDGRTVILTDSYWSHIKFRHPEVKNDPTLLMSVVKSPDETYFDERGGVHVLKKLDESHFVVIIYEIENKVAFFQERRTLPMQKGDKGGTGLLDS